MRIGIIGSRKFPELDLVYDYIAHLGHEQTIVSGGAVGVDAAAIEAAHELGLNYEEVLPDTSACRLYHHYAQAYYARNTRLIEQVDKLVAFTEKDTGGTWDTIKKARRKGIDVEVIRPRHHIPKPGPQHQKVKGKGPFHLKRVGFGSAALHMKKYFPSVEWADFLLSKQDDPVRCAKHMLPDFLAFFRDTSFGHIDAITQAPKSIRNQHKPHPMDTVCTVVADTLQVPYIQCFAPWAREHRGRNLHVPSLTLLPEVLTYKGKIVFVLDDVSTTNLTLQTAIAALHQQGIHAHAVAWVRY